MSQKDQKKKIKPAKRPEPPSRGQNQPLSQRVVPKKKGN